MDLVTIPLQRAFGEPGCPLCRLRQQGERRYLLSLLYENVNDGLMRRHLVRGMGLCPEHAWALQAVEQEHYHDGLGVGIIYEDLTRRVLGSLTDHLERNGASRADQRARLRRRLGGSGRLGRWLARRLLPLAPGAALRAELSPRERCRACKLVGDLEEINLNGLVRGLDDPEFRGSYAASDGLCLPHLGRALDRAEDEWAVRCLAEVAAARLEPLVRDLGEYVRKHDWNNRHEPKSPRELASWVRAVALLAGEAPQAEGDGVHRLRRKALADGHGRTEDTI